MKPFNKELHEDIALLRTLHAKKDKAEFNILKAEIMRKHGISKATVYREMKKETPGMYKIPNYNPPKMDIRIPEVLKVRELLIAGRQSAEIIKIMAGSLASIITGIDLTARGQWLRSLMKKNTIPVQPRLQQAAAVL